MRLEISESVNASEWDTKICLVGGTIFHSSIWARYTVAAHPQVMPQFITLLSDDGKFLGAALGFQGCSQHKLIARFTKRLWFDAMPLVLNNDEKIFYEFLNLLDIHARCSNVVELSIGSYASREASRKLGDLGFTLTKRLEFELCLERSEDELWNGLDYKRKKNIKKAKRIGVTIHGMLANKGISELRRLQCESGHRILERSGPDLIYKEQHSQDPVHVLVESGFGRIVGAEIEGTLVSTSLFTCFNNSVYHMLSGHSQRALQTQAPTLLLWESIKRYRDEGVKRFNLGGCKVDAVDDNSPEHGVYVYKKAFGAECLECVSGEKILRKTAYGIVGIIKSFLRR